MRWKFFRRTEDGRRMTERNRPLSVPGLRSELRCPLCGKTFESGEAMQCAACGLAKQCGLVMCPNCAYEFAA